MPFPSANKLCSGSRKQILLAPAVTIAASSSGLESVVAPVIEVSLNIPSPLAVSVQYSVTGGTATAIPSRMREICKSGLAGLGLTVLCGGRQGVMEAVCRGVERAGGLSVGLLPEGDPAAANRHVSVPIATGIGVARNAIIARAALALVAVGGGTGTIAEAAFGLQFGVPVFGLLDAPALDGVCACPDPETAVKEVAKTVLKLPGND